MSKKKKLKEHKADIAKIAASLPHIYLPLTNTKGEYIGLQKLTRQVTGQQVIEQGVLTYKKKATKAGESDKIRTVKETKSYEFDTEYYITLNHTRNIEKALLKGGWEAVQNYVNKTMLEAKAQSSIVQKIKAEVALKKAQDAKSKS